MKVDGVFAGGGSKAIAFIGALQEVEKRGITFERLAGTSAGAIMASFIKAGYTSDEMHEILAETDFRTFLDETCIQKISGFTKWLSVYWTLGLYKGDVLEQWLEKCLRRKGVRTFSDLPPGSLRVVASDLTSGQLLVLPDDLPKYGINPDRFSIAKAVRMSCSLPYFFRPVKIWDGAGEAHVIVDGGILSNFPIWLFAEENEQKWLRPFIGFQLSPGIYHLPPKKIKNAFHLYTSLFDTMRKAHDLRYITKSDAKNVVFISVEEVKSTDFDLTKEEVDDLIKKGEKVTSYFLKKWC